MIQTNHTHSFLNLQTKLFKLRFVLWQISSKLSKICSIHLHTRQITQNSHQLLTHLYYIMFQPPDPADNSQEFQRITQIPCSSNYAKFAPFVNPFYSMFQMPDQIGRG